MAAWSSLQWFCKAIKTMIYITKSVVCIDMINTFIMPTNHKLYLTNTKVGYIKNNLEVQKIHQRGVKVLRY